MAVHCTHSRIALILIASLLGCGGSTPPLKTSAQQPTAQTVPTPSATQKVAAAEVDDSHAFEHDPSLEPVLAPVSSDQVTEQTTKSDAKVSRDQARIPSDLDTEDMAFRKPSPREWTAKGGAFKVNATLAAFVEGVAVLQKADGKFARVPLDKLSEADVQYLKEIIKVHPKAYLITGTVTSIVTGSEVIITSADGPHEVALFGIASPREDQYYHMEAKEALAKRISNKQVWFEWAEKSDAGKPLGVLYHNGQNINLELVAEGLAWCDPKYTAAEKFLNAQTIAKSKRIGLWQNPDPKAPWE